MHLEMRYKRCKCCKNRTITKSIFCQITWWHFLRYLWAAVDKLCIYTARKL